MRTKVSPSNDRSSAVRPSAYVQPAWLRRTLLAVIVVLASPAGAQREHIEILSKADALQLFAMSRPQWEANIAAAVTGGMATRLPEAPSELIGMSVKTPHGYAVTRLDYSKGDAKPDWIQVTIAYRPGQGPHFTEALTQEFFVEVQRQMAPEFEVVGHVERIQGGLAFFFSISEAKKPIR